jgi:chromosome segregation ATPase
MMTNLKQIFLGSSPQPGEELAALKHENAKLKAELEAAAAEISELKGKYDHILEVANQELCAKEDVIKRYHHLAGEYENLQQRHLELMEEHREAQNEAHEVKKLQQSDAAAKHRAQEQVAQFKKLISSSSQMENQVADDVIRKQSDQLFYGIQDFVVNTFRGVTFGMLSEDGCLAIGALIEFRH